MRYLVKARLKAGREAPLQQAINDGTLGQGSVAGDEYLHDMQHARQLDNGTVCWVETCFCPTPLQEEQPYWEEYFELLKIKNAHDPRRCKDLNGTEPWACCECDCTERLEARMRKWGEAFLPNLRKAAAIE